MSVWTDEEQSCGWQGAVEGCGHGEVAPGVFEVMEPFFIRIVVVVTGIHLCIQIYRTVQKKSTLVENNVKNFKKEACHSYFELSLIWHPNDFHCLGAM